MRGPGPQNQAQGHRMPRARRHHGEVEATMQDGHPEAKQQLASPEPPSPRDGHSPTSCILFPVACTQTLFRVEGILEPPGPTSVAPGSAKIDPHENADLPGARLRCPDDRALPPGDSRPAPTSPWASCTPRRQIRPNRLFQNVCIHLDTRARARCLGHEASCQLPPERNLSP